MTSQIATFGQQLGAFRIYTPLHVDLNECPSGKWVARLEPASQTCHEFGYGETPGEAIEDLASTMGEMYDKLWDIPDEMLGPDLLAYKGLLRQCAIPNTTREVR